MTPARQLRSQSFLWLMAFVALMTACGDGDGNNDTILTGFSGVLIFGLVVWLIVHFVRKSGK
jgi:hypothetical protein